MIGILDSGLGGLSVLNEIHKLLPNESALYLGDSAFCPYGNKPAGQIIERCRHITEWLIDRQVKLIVIACNSATIAAVGTLRSEYPINFVGMEPAVKPACLSSRSGVVGVLATEASLAGEKFHRLIHTHARDQVRVITRPCPRFVELVEAGKLSGPEAEQAVDEAITPLLSAGADTLVLGCTHYPFLKEIISRRAGSQVRLIDTGEAVARRVSQVLSDQDELASPSSQIHYQLHSSGDPAILRRLLPLLSPKIAALKGLKIGDQAAQFPFPA